MATDAAVRERRILWGAAAGLAAPVIFPLLHIALAFLTPGYDQLRDPIGALALQPMGWIQSLDFVLVGILYVVFARGLAAAMLPNLGPWLHAAAGLGAVVMGLFPWHPNMTGVQGASGHVVGAYMAILGSAVGFLALWQPMRNDPRWHAWAYPTLVVGLLIVTLFLGYGWYVEPSGAALHAWDGALQRMVVNVWLLWTFLLAWHLRGVAQLQGPVQAETRPPLVHPGEPAA
jgi:hypothetical protein